MARIAISYRRADSAGYAGRLYDSLSAHFSAHEVFMDISALEPGVDFVEAIQRAVATCDVMLALIGPQWLTASDANGRRLDNAEDFVRLEVGTALDRDIRVIPVLIQGAAMPRPEQLPDQLTRLTRRQAFELSDGRWQYDVGRLIDTLERLLSTGETPIPQGRERLDTEARPSPSGLPLLSPVWYAALVFVAWLVGAYVGELLSYEEGWRTAIDDVALDRARLTWSWAWMAGGGLGGLAFGIAAFGLRGRPVPWGRLFAIAAIAAIGCAGMEAVALMARAEAGLVNPDDIGAPALLGAIGGAALAGAFGGWVAERGVQWLRWRSPVRSSGGIVLAALGAAGGAAIRWGVAFEDLRGLAWLLALVLVGWAVFQQLRGKPGRHPMRTGDAG